MADETITVETERFGTVRCPREALIRTPNGVIGYDDRTLWLLLGNAEKGAMMLQSAQDPALGFVVAPMPYVVAPPWRMLPEWVVDTVAEGDRDALQWWVVLNSVGGRIVANTCAPLVIGCWTHIGEHLHLNGPGLTLRHPVDMDRVRAIAGGAN